MLVPPLSGITLPDGRERCFTRFNPELAFCQACPGWIREQCQQYVNTTGSPTAPRQSLGDLSKQLAGDAGDDEEVPF